LAWTYLSLNGKKKTFAFVLSILSLLVLSSFSISPAMALTPTTFTTGMVLAGTGGYLVSGTGTITQINPTTGAIVGQLQTSVGNSEDTGMCFESDGTLLTTNWPASSYGMSHFATDGSLLQATWNKSPISSHGESCVRNAAGNILVGQTDGALISEWAPDGTFIKSWTPTTYDRGIDWLDLASNQCTVLYAGEGNRISSYDICTSTQNPDFATGMSGPCYATRIRPNGEVMTACGSGNVYRFDSSGTLLKSCPINTPTGSPDSLFAMNLDPDGVSFWTAGYSSGLIYHVDIATCSIIKTIGPIPFSPSIAGLAVVGELTVGCEPHCGGTSVPEFSAPAAMASALGLLAVAVLVRKRSSIIGPLK